jgi:hypothetical protein
MINAPLTLMTLMTLMTVIMTVILERGSFLKKNDGGDTREL